MGHSEAIYYTALGNIHSVYIYLIQIIKPLKYPRQLENRRKNTGFKLNSQLLLQIEQVIA